MESIFFDNTKSIAKKRQVLFSVLYLCCLMPMNIKLYLDGDHSFSALFFVDLLACLFLLVLIISFSAIARQASEDNVPISKKLLVLLVGSLIISLILEALTLFGSPVHSALSLSDWHLKRIVVFFALAYSVLTFLTIYKKRICGFIKEKTNGITKKKAAYLLVALFVLCLVSFFSSVVFSSLLNISQKALWIFIFLLLCCVVGITALIVKKKARTELVFLFLSLAIGGSIALIPPAQTGISWDDQIHYPKALGVSYLEDPAFSEGNNALINVAYFPEDFLPDKSAETVNQYHGYIKELDSHGSFEVQGSVAPGHGSSIVTYGSLGYIPSAMGLWIGRVFHLSIVHDFTLGRLFNLLFYVLMCFLAIRITPVKKTLLACVALLPTSLFLAANYSYDPWVTSFMMLGAALFLKEYHSDKEISWKRVFAIIVVFILGLGPKAIYFPILGIMLLMPRKKFSSRKKYYQYIGLIFLAGFIVLFSFLAPYISSSGGGSGDARGGSDVSASGQTAFILSNPIGYIGILGSFIFNVLLTIPASNDYSFLLGYFGKMTDIVPFFSGVSFVALLVIGLLDVRKKEKEPRVSERIWIAFLVLLTIALVSTALYIDFTPVGLSTINGVQKRYLIPLLFVVIAMCFSYKLPGSKPSNNVLVACQCFYGGLGFLCVATVLLPCMIL